MAGPGGRGPGGARGGVEGPTGARERGPARVPAPGGAPRAHPEPAAPDRSPAPPLTGPPETPPAGPAGPVPGTPRPPEARAPEARPLDPIDRSILRLLQRDGRASIRSVAEQVHVSRANAYARVNRLIDEGVIQGFTARVDHERAGQGASAYITLKIVQNSWRTVREQLRELPGAAHIALVSGDFDVLLLVHTPDNRTLRELVLTRLQAIPEVLSTRTLLVFEETDLLDAPPGTPVPRPQAPLDPA
ncbi:Lrp/AsnC family transcriptional regulator [Streptomyces sp. BI20]|uniref:Lrp/AsnC family transcriptional regulator n=1 Tax=Streptomyces sp. BI20 TaxID=3403460 RepID=UPI003C792A6E